MILAAGRGERMRPLTDDVPKPLLEVGGQALIDYPLRALAAAGIEEVVVNTAYRGAQIRAALGEGERYGLRIRYSIEASGALDSGGGIRQAVGMLGDGPFLVANADVLSDYPFAWLLEWAGCMTGDALAHLVLVPNPDYRMGGDFGLAGGRVTNQKTFTFAGFGLYRADLLREHPPGAFSIVPLLREAAHNGWVSGELYRGWWTDVGTPERLRQARAKFERD
jgi:MurNAc alpha-1-phosphate uridylyltransferase